MLLNRYIPVYGFVLYPDQSIVVGIPTDTHTHTTPHHPQEEQRIFNDNICE